MSVQSGSKFFLEYYALDAGPNTQPLARDNFRLLAGSKLRELIYSQVGYDPASHTQLLFRFGDQLGRQFHTLKKRRHRQTGAFEAGKSQAGKAPLAPSGAKSCSEFRDEDVSPLILHPRLGN